MVSGFAGYRNTEMTSREKHTLTDREFLVLRGDPHDYRDPLDSPHQIPIPRGPGGRALDGGNDFTQLCGHYMAAHSGKHTHARARTTVRVSSFVSAVCHGRFFSSFTSQSHESSSTARAADERSLSLSLSSVSVSTPHPPPSVSLTLSLSLSLSLCLSLSLPGVINGNLISRLTAAVCARASLELVFFFSPCFRVGRLDRRSPPVRVGGVGSGESVRAALRHLHELNRSSPRAASRRARRGQTVATAARNTNTNRGNKEIQSRSPEH